MTVFLLILYTASYCTLLKSQSSGPFLPRFDIKLDYFCHDKGRGGRQRPPPLSGTE